MCRGQTAAMIAHASHIRLSGGDEAFYIRSFDLSSDGLITKVVADLSSATADVLWLTHERPPKTRTWNDSPIA